MLENANFQFSILSPNIDRQSVLQAPNNFSTVASTPIPEPYTLYLRPGLLKCNKPYIRV
jgi:hypothetical protein